MGSLKTRLPGQACLQRRATILSQRRLGRASAMTVPPGALIRTAYSAPWTGHLLSRVTLQEGLSGPTRQVEDLDDTSYCHYYYHQYCADCLGVSQRLECCWCLGYLGSYIAG